MVLADVLVVMMIFSSFYNVAMALALEDDLSHPSHPSSGDVDHHE
jgi:hypothetical protein